MKINNIEFTIDSIGGAENDILFVFPHSEFTHFFSTIELDKPVNIEGYENFTEIKCVVVNPSQYFSLQVGSNINDEESIKIITTKESVSIQEAKDLRYDIQELAKKIETDSEAESYTWTFPLWHREGVYMEGYRSQYNGLLYRCIKGHSASDHGTPDEEPTIWVRTKDDRPASPNVDLYNDVEALSHKDEFPVYAEGVQYHKGDRVFFEGKLYKCDGEYLSNQWTVNGGPWYCLDDLLEWDSTRGYEYGDGVLYNGYCYVDQWGCTNENGDPNTFEPTDERYWTKL